MFGAHRTDARLSARALEEEQRQLPELCSQECRSPLALSSGEDDLPSLHLPAFALLSLPLLPPSSVAVTRWGFIEQEFSFT